MLSYGHKKIRVSLCTSLCTSSVLDMTLNCSGVRLDNQKVFFVHQVLGPNFLSVVLSFKKQYNIHKLKGKFKSSLLNLKLILTVALKFVVCDQILNTTS